MVENVLLQDFEGGLPPTAVPVNAVNSPAGADSFSGVAVAAESGSQRLVFSDSGGFRNGIVYNIPGAAPQPGVYLITADVKVVNNGGAVLDSLGMGLSLGHTTSKINDVHAGYVMNLPQNGMTAAALGYQTIGAMISVPAGGSFPKDITLYFSSDVSGNSVNGANDGDFAGGHRGSTGWQTATNTNAVYIDNIRRVGPGNWGEERHSWISVGDQLTNTARLDTWIAGAKNNGFNVIDMLARYRANGYYRKNRNFNTFSHNEPAASGVSASNDPLQYVIDKAHEQGLKVYAAFSCFLVTDGVNGTNYPSALPAGSVTYVHDTNLNPPYRPQTTADDNEGLWADPGRADVRAHTINVLKDLVQNYDIDGVMFDRVRYASTNFGYNPQALDELGAGRGFNRNNPPSPLNADFIAARQEAITTFVHDAYEAVTNIKPWVVVGSTPIAYGTSFVDTYTRVMQHIPSWNSRPTGNRMITFGVQDLIQPQFYRMWDSGSSAAPGGNRTLIQKAMYGDTAVYSRDYGWFPGSMQLLSPLFYSNGHSSEADAQNTAAALATNIRDTRSSPTYVANGFGIFSSETLYDADDSFGVPLVNRIRQQAPDPLGSVAPPFPDYLMKRGYDNVPPLAVGSPMASAMGLSVALSWTAPAPAADGETAVRYLIYRSNTSSVPQYYSNQVAPGQVITGTTYSDTGFPSSGNYWYLIVPVDDYNNRGPATLVGPVTAQNGSFIVESRQPGGALTPTPAYQESPVWADTSSKSSAPGLVGTGSRYGLTFPRSATFRPNLPVSGGYSVYVTLDDAGSGQNNNAQMEYTINSLNGPVTGSVVLAPTTPGLANNWLLLESNVQLPSGQAAGITFTYDGVPQAPAPANRACMDAVKFELTSSNIDEWSLY